MERHSRCPHPVGASRRISPGDDRLTACCRPGAKHETRVPRSHALTEIADAPPGRGAVAPPPGPSLIPISLFLDIAASEATDGACVPRTLRDLAYMLGAAERLHALAGGRDPSPPRLWYTRLVTIAPTLELTEQLATAWNHGQRLSTGQAVAIVTTAIVHGASRLESAVAPQSTAVDALTAREQEVLVLLMQGLSDRAIADRLFISPHTASTHVKHLRAKLGGGSRSAAIVRAFLTISTANGFPASVPPERELTARPK